MKYLCIVLIFGAFSFGLATEETTLTTSSVGANSQNLSVKIGEVQHKALLEKLNSVKNTLIKKHHHSKDRNLQDSSDHTAIISTIQNVINEINAISPSGGVFAVPILTLKDIVDLLKNYQTMTEDSSDSGTDSDSTTSDGTSQDTSGTSDSLILTGDRKSRRKRKMKANAKKISHVRAMKGRKAHNTNHHHHDKSIRLRHGSGEIRRLRISSHKDKPTVRNIPHMMEVANDVSLEYQDIFEKVNHLTNGTNTFQQAAYYLSLYSVVRNFAVSFQRHRDYIEGDLTSIVEAISLEPFAKTEILSFFGYIDLYNSLKLTTQAFQTPFLAQDQLLTNVCSKFATIFSNIAKDVENLFDQHNSLAKLTNYLTSKDPKIANPSIQDLKTVDAALLLIPGILTIYTTIQNTMADLQNQLASIEALNTQMQTVISNMQLIVSGQAGQGKKANVNTAFTIWLAAIVLGMVA